MENSEHHGTSAATVGGQQPKSKKTARVATPGGQVASPKAKPSGKATAAKKPHATPTKAGELRRHSKAAKLLDLLQRPNGATLKELMRASRWQAHSVRGFLSAQIRKRMELKLRSFEREGERVYAVDR